MMEPGPQDCRRASEIIRKQKRKALDAQRSKCRIRIGNHLEQWCLLKDQLGFSLHSQLAKYLLDRYSSHASVLKPGLDNPDVLPDPVPSDALQHLVVLSHHHSQECHFLPHVKPALWQQENLPTGLVWECLAGHTFSWGPPTPMICPPPVCQAASRGREEKEERKKAVSSKPSPPPSPITRCRRSLRRAAAAHAISLALASNSPCPEDEETEKSSREDGEGGADRKRTACMSPGNGAGLGKEAGLPSGNTIGEPAAAPEEISSSTEPSGPGSTVASPEEIPESVSDPPEEEEGEGDDFAEDDSGLFTDDLRDENYQRSLDSFMKKSQTRDEEISQIGPKRIRKAAKREILLCDYDGCGKIFSNRQYLNHHKKYQHVHQKTFTCSDPTCGKSFNFKKHLKEHEKLHSDKRDYICEFCARSFRTSSNLIIHRRIHTGEKPLQCEICGFTCRQKASLNWHMKKHDADSFYQFSCDLCGKRFEKKDNVTAHKSKSHPEVTAWPPPAVEEPLALSSSFVMEQRTDPLQSQFYDTSAAVITVILE